MKVMRRGNVTKKDLERVLSDKLSGVHTLCSPGNRSFTAFMREKQIRHYKSKFVGLNTAKSVTGMKRGIQMPNLLEGGKKAEAGYKINNVLKYVGLWRHFMRRFKGVATKYLQNYLNWYVLLDKLKYSTIPIVHVTDILWDSDSSWHRHKAGKFNTDFST
jgi:hypothetical protein